MRSAAIVLVGVGLLVASLPAAAQSITRIESQPIYGASVTVEERVRVIRPLPRGREQACSQPDACSHNRTYLHRIGDTAGSGRYIRRVLETQPLGGPR